MRHRKNFWGMFAVLVFAFLLAGCGDNGDSSNERDQSVYQPTLMPSLQATPMPAQDRTVSASVDGNGTSQATNQRIVIKSAELTITVENPAETVQEITQFAENTGGWIISSNVMTSNDVMTGEISIRVPAEQFTSAIESIKSSAIQVDSETVLGQDVTQEYTDLESELVNLELAEAQIQGFLELAEDTDAVLRVHDKLITVHGQIETAQGRLNYFSDSAAYSSIAVNLAQPEPEPEPIEKPAKKEDKGWQPSRTLENAWGSFVALMQVIADILIWVIVFFVPILLVLVVIVSPVWFGWRYWQRRDSLGN